MKKDQFSWCFAGMILMVLSIIMALVFKTTSPLTRIRILATLGTVGILAIVIAALKRRDF